MPSQSAKVIDIQSYRALRRAARPITVAELPVFSVADAATIAWIPVWFMPVMVFGMPLTAD